MPLERLFVYGTLQPGGPNAHVLDSITGEWSRASVRGTLFEIGWGAAMGYPGLVLDEAGDEIRGFVLASDNLGPEWERLDAFEGEGYERVLAEVSLGDGRSVESWLYVVAPRET